MRSSVMKRVVQRAFFPEGAVRRIMAGPLRGMHYRVSPITGLSAWYSGPERDLQRTLAAHVRPGQVVADLGANWGCHTLLLSRLVGEAGCVLACDPYLPAYADLEWHLEANGCDNVIAQWVAVGAADGWARFLPGPNAYTGHLDFTGDERGIPVAVRTLDSLAEELDLARLDLVKIDVEGAEGQVLCGAEDVVRRFAPVLIIELHNPEQDVAVARWLTGHGYDFQRLSGPPITDPTQGWPAPGGVWGTLVATPG